MNRWEENTVFRLIARLADVRVADGLETHKVPPLSTASSILYVDTQHVFRHGILGDLKYEVAGNSIMAVSERPKQQTNVSCVTFT